MTDIKVGYCPGVTKMTEKEEKSGVHVRWRRCQSTHGDKYFCRPSFFSFFFFLIFQIHKTAPAFILKRQFLASEPLLPPARVRK